MIQVVRVQGWIEGVFLLFQEVLQNPRRDASCTDRPCAGANSAQSALSFLLRRGHVNARELLPNLPPRSVRLQAVVFDGRPEALDELREGFVGGSGKGRRGEERRDRSIAVATRGLCENLHQHVADAVPTRRGHALDRHGREAARVHLS